MPWSGWSDQQLWSHLRDNEQGVDHGSRVWLRERLREWGETHSLLDVGCGTGVEYEGIRREGLQTEYVGLDACERAIALARRTYPETRMRRWWVGDAGHLPCADNSFDVVLLRHVLEHLPDFRPAVREALRVACCQVVLIFFWPPGEEQIPRMHEGTHWNRYRLADVLDCLDDECSVRIETAPDLGVNGNFALVGHL